MSNKAEHTFVPKRTIPSTRKVGFWTVTLVGLCVAGLYYHRVLSNRRYSSKDSLGTPAKIECPFPLPNHLLREQPLRSDEDPLALNSQKLHSFLSRRASHPDIDSISIAIVTPTGTLFEKSYGVLKANETASERPVSRDSIYRIASITKMFTMLETLILREQGVLNLDDPVEKFLPEVKYPAYGWSDYLGGSGVHDESQTTKPRVSLRQLGSHMSGIGRDYPPHDIGEWPQKSPLPSLMRSVRTRGDFPFPQRRYHQVLKAVNKYPLINPPYSYPVYSNTGFDILGLANVAANRLAKPQSGDQPQSHRDLIKSDIFDSLGLNHSFYRVPYGTSLVGDLAIPKEDHDWADAVFDEADEPAGGQYSSLADLEIVMQSLLDPSRNGGLLSEQVVREWLHPLFTWKNGFQEAGGPWEVTTVDENVRLYMKGGNLPGYHSEFVLVPEFQYGIIALVTGTYENTAALVHQATSLFQPAIRALLQERVVKAYVGNWIGAFTDEEEITAAQIQIINGGLYLTELVVRGYDVLKIIEDISLRKPSPVALWSTGRPGEFRLAFGRKALNSDPTIGCLPYWVSIDNPLFSRGAPIDLVYWDGDELIYPSGGVRLKRRV